MSDSYLMTDYSLKYALKERGHTDEQIAHMTPEDKFADYCNWHGLIGWGPQLLRIWAECQGGEPVLDSQGSIKAYMKNGCILWSRSY